MKNALIGGICLMAISSGASAATVVFDFRASSAGIHHVGANTKTFTSGGLSITATGYSYEAVSTTPATPIELSQKNDGGDEHGLGLANDTANGEIKYHQGFIQLDFTNLYAHHAQGATFSMGSTTNGEQWAVYGSDTAGSYDTKNLIMESAAYAATGDGSATLKSFGDWTFYDFVEIGHTTTNPKVNDVNDNVLLESVSVTTATPEPAAWALMVIGVGGMGAALRTRRRQLAV